jgi:hypothetical protein
MKDLLSIIPDLVLLNDLFPGKLVWSRLPHLRLQIEPIVPISHMVFQIRLFLQTCNDLAKEGTLLIVSELL